MEIGNVAEVEGTNSGQNVVDAPNEHVSSKEGDKELQDLLQNDPTKLGELCTPLGLRIGQIENDLVQCVSAEILPCFPAHSRQRAALEVGWTLDKARCDQLRALQVMPLADFPSLQALISQAMQALGHFQELDEVALNVSCLLYSSGHGIPMHSDRPCYKEAIYGCIIHNTSDRTLEFYKPAKGGASTADHFSLKEFPGICFEQCGDARYVWKHQVKPLTHGQRLSVTWRWFTADVLLCGE